MHLKGQTMNALVYVAPRRLELRELQHPWWQGTDGPTSVPPQGECVLRVDAVGICGSEMHGWHGRDPRRQPGLVMGHEAAGTVLRGPLSGERVAFNPLVSCLACSSCLRGRTNLCEKRELIGMNRPGAFAELVAVPERNLFILPDGLPMHRAALMEPCATAIHAVELGTRGLDIDLASARVLVFGAGSVGLLGALVLRQRGAEVQLVECNPLRRDSAIAVGLDARESPEGPFDLVYDAVGVAATRAQAMRLLRPGGVLTHVGLGEAKGGLDPRTMTLSELTFIGSYTYTDADLRAALQVLAGLEETPWIERRPLSEGQQAFEDLDAGRSAAAKIILEPR